MSKTIKGARVRLKRSDVPTDVPTIPTNDDHTTGWLDTDIYIGELFLNTSSTTPGLWFRDSSGTTKVATLDRTTNKLPLNLLPSNITTITNNFTSSVTIVDTIVVDTQYIMISDYSNPGISAINNILLNNLEIDGASIVNISLTTVLSGGTLTVRIKDSLNNNIITVTDANTRGIILMWNGTNWTVLSVTKNPVSTNP
jgi:hypothetical protein